MLFLKLAALIEFWGDKSEDITWELYIIEKGQNSSQLVTAYSGDEKFLGGVEAEASYHAMIP